jgi:hypothetical protein
MNQGHATVERNWLSSGGKIVLLIILAVIGWFLFTQHGVHLFTVLPYLLLLACPFMHMFMHRGHGKHGNDRGGHH